MRWMRWLVAVAATVAVFGGCLWLFRFASWSWMPQATSDRWAVAAAFATVTAGAVGRGRHLVGKPGDPAAGRNRRSGRRCGWSWWSRGRGAVDHRGRGHQRDRLHRRWRY